MTTEPDDLFNFIFEEALDLNQAAALTISIWKTS